MPGGSTSREAREGDIVAAETDADGRFKIEGLLDTEYDVSAFKWEWQTARRSVHLGKEGSLPFMLKKPRTVTARVIDSDGRSVERVDGLEASHERGTFQETLLLDSPPLASRTYSVAGVGARRVKLTGERPRRRGATVPQSAMAAR